MPKNKSHRALLKRIKITKSGLVKIGRAGQRHLKSHKSADRIRAYRSSRYAKSADMNRLSAMLNRKIRSYEQAQRDKAERAERAESSAE